MRRWISLAVTVAMILPVAASVAEGAMATWLSPQAGQIVSGGKVEVAVGYNTGSKLKVTSVDLYVDGQFYGRKILRAPEVRGVISFWWDTTRVERGTHSLVVKVYSDEQVISKVYGTGTVGPNGGSGGLLDVRPPVVTFANIKAGDVIKGTKTIKLDAVDDSGKDPMVSLTVDNDLKLLKNNKPYTYDLDSATYVNGGHSLKTYAYDAAGNRSDPAVIAVEFRNGDTSPAVTTLSVTPEPTPAPAPVRIAKATPPPMPTDSAPSTKGGAARAVTRLAANSSAAAPVAAVTKAQTKTVSAPVPVDVASAAASTRDGLKPSVAASASAASPAAIPAPSASGVRNASASRLPSARATLMSAPVLASGSEPAVPKVTEAPKPVVMASAKLVEPKQMVLAPAPKHPAPAHVSVAPKPSGPVKMATASRLPVVHRITQSALPSAAVAAVPRIVAEPVNSSVKNVPVDHSAAVKTTKIARASVSGAAAVAPRALAPPTPKISKSALKRVQVALGPDFRTAADGVGGMSAISSPQVVVKPAKARIEKTTMPASGKVKARSFFQEMGGVLFWDPSTHTVTACVGGMVIEMQIGNKVARVNGREFTMDTAPYIQNGRTIFEAGSYTQACGLLESATTIANAQVD